MNWVGGSRSRFVLKNDTRKQREFFERKKMQKKMEHLGFPVASQGAATGSMDLVTLFMVNQIATKKNKNHPKITQFSQEKGPRRSMHEDPLELPMSPCSPSCLPLMDSQPQYNVQTLGLRKRKHSLQNHTQLSPVLESSFSDGSASDYRHHAADPFSPFSSAASGSSAGRVSDQHRPEQQHCTPLVWDSSHSEQMQFVPFSQPRGLREDDPWKMMTHKSQFGVQNHSVSRVQFGTMESCLIGMQKTSGQALQTSGSFLSLSTEQEELETGLMGLDSREDEGQATTFDSGQIINLQGATPPTTIQDLTESQHKHPHADFVSQPFDKGQPADCCGFRASSLQSCGSLCSLTSGGAFSSDSDSGEDGACPCLQRHGAGGRDSYCDEAPFTPMSAAPPCGRGHNTASPSTQIRRTPGTSESQSAGCHGVRTEGQMRSSVGERDQFVPSHLQPGSEHSWKNVTEQERQPSGMREAGTQTDSVIVPRMLDAAIQCSLGWEDKLSASFCSGSQNHPQWATRGHSGPADELLVEGPCVVTPDSLAEEEPLIWSKCGPAAQQNHRAVLPGQQLLSGATETLSRPQMPACAQRDSTPVLESIGLCNTQEQRDEVWREQVKQVEMESRTQERVRQMGRAAENREEAHTLQEIADILLTLKQKNGH